MSKNTKIIITSLSLLVVVAGVVAWLQLSGQIHLFGQDNKPSPEEIKANQDKKSATASDNSIPTSQQQSSSTINNSPSKQAPQQGTYTAPTSSDNIILSASRSDQSTVAITTQLKGYSDGTCNLQITNGTKSYTHSAPVLFQREFATCAGFSVPVSQLGTGTWNITLNVTSAQNTLSKTIQYEVN